MTYNAAIIGGGIFGVNIAIELAKINGLNIHLFEKEQELMGAASKYNHNRIHLGYHYLRSTRTAMQSLDGLLTFMFNYGDAVVYQFPNFYGIAKENSKTDTEGFKRFCDRLRIDYEESWPDKQLMNPKMLDSCFRVPEPIFDYKTLKKNVLRRLEKSSVDINMGCQCEQIEKISEDFKVQVNGKKMDFDFLINASYSQFNFFNRQLGVSLKKLLFQDVFIPVFNYPSSKFGLTVMDGPFCSIMPKGFEKNRFLLYHVVYSVLSEKMGIHEQVNGEFDQQAIERIMEDSTQYYPFLADVEITDVWRTNRVLNKNNDDARMTELFMYDKVENYYAVLSGKITTCCKVAREIQRLIKDKIS